MIAEYVELKDQLEGILNVLENEPSDTSPQRIINRRKKLGKYYRGIEGMKNLVKNKPDKIKSPLLECVILLEDYFHYFDTEYSAVFNIDTLPDLLHGKIALMIEEMNKE